MKPRECWGLVDNDSGKIKDLRKIGEGGIRNNDHKILMREVVPDTVSITRKEFKKLLLSCVQKGDGSIIGMFDEMEMAIFDPQTTKAKGRT